MSAQTGDTFTYIDPSRLKLTIYPHYWGESMSTYRVGDTRILAGNLEVWTGYSWAYVRHWPPQFTTAEILADYHRRNHMSTTERTVVVNNVTLTEGEVRDAVRKLDALPAVLLRDLKPGDWYKPVTAWDSGHQLYPRMVLAPSHFILQDSRQYVMTTVDSLGTIGYDAPKMEVQRYLGVIRG